jgi:hypothetical protein
MANEAIQEEPGAQAGKFFTQDLMALVILSGMVLFISVLVANHIFRAETHLNEAVKEIAKRDAALTLSLSRLFPEYASEIIRAFDVDPLAQCHQGAQEPGAMDPAR